ncbi:hypothetical protein ACJX0J_009050, partial [Zea mays]
MVGAEKETMWKKERGNIEHVILIETQWNISPSHVTLFLYFPPNLIFLDVIILAQILNLQDRNNKIGQAYTLQSFQAWFFKKNIINTGALLCIAIIYKDKNILEIPNNTRELRTTVAHIVVPLCYLKCLFKFIYFGIQIFNSGKNYPEKIYMNKLEKKNHILQA